MASGDEGTLARKVAIATVAPTKAAGRGAGEEERDVARRGQGHRPADEATHQRGAGGRLQHRRQGDADR